MMFQLPLIIETLSPVVLAKSSGANIMAPTEDFFLGSVVRGVLAGQYLADKKLICAEQDKNFYDLFLSGKVTFGPAYPMKDGQVGEFLPLTLMRDKSYGKICDLLKETAEAGFKGLRGLGIINNDNKIAILNIQKNLEFHMSRQNANERITGSSTEGQIYNYESLAAGQKFQSCLMGSKEDLEKILALLPSLKDGKIVFIGRSKHTQYGKCKLQFGVVESCDVKAETSKLKVAIKFTTDFIPQDSCFGSAQQALQDLTEILKNWNIEVDLGQIFSMVGTQEGFVGIWGVKRELRRCLKAGSVVELVKRDGEWTCDDLEKLQELGCHGIGHRIVDGFGRFILYSYNAPKELPFVKNDDEKKPEHPTSYSDDVKDIVKKVLWAEITERLQKVAAEDRDERLQKIAAEDRDERLQNKKISKHLFARLENLIEKGEQLNQVIGKKTIAAENLRSLSGKNNVNLYEILCGDKPAPYQERWDEEIITEDMKKLEKEMKAESLLPKENDKEVFKIYWRWYCRMARKKLKDSEGKGDEE